MAFFKRQRGRGRRREDDGTHAVTFELDDLEFVRASDELGLLRVGGRWHAPFVRPLGAIVLVARRGDEVLELVPLPDLNGVAPIASPAGEGWRGAFTMGADVVEDPRLELTLVADDDASVELPRPGDADEEEVDPEPPAAADPDPESPVVAELLARLEEVADLDDEGPQPVAAALVDEEEPFDPTAEVSVEVVEPPVAEPIAMPAPPAPDLEPLVAELRTELDLQRIQLEETRLQLDAERRRREALEQELSTRASVEDDLRNAMAMQEAELAAAVAQASQRVRREERRRDLTPPPGERKDGVSRQSAADDDFLARLERARRASETAPA